jgi:hypothetical protein
VLQIAVHCDDVSVTSGSSNLERCQNASAVSSILSLVDDFYIAVASRFFLENFRRPVRGAVVNAHNPVDLLRQVGKSLLDQRWNCFFFVIDRDG